MIFESIIGLLFIITIIAIIVTRNKDDDIDLFLIKQKLEDIEKDIEWINDKLTPILQELGYDVKPNWRYRK